jgi:hypothetical protein
LQKNERPVGVPAALAWGLGGNLTEDQGRREFSCRTGCGALAKIRKMHSTKNAMTMLAFYGSQTLFPMIYDSTLHNCVGQ